MDHRETAHQKKKIGDAVIIHVVFQGNFQNTTCFYNVGSQ